MIRKALSPEKVAARIKRLSTVRPSIAIILGSGFQFALRDWTVDCRVPYGSLRGFPAVNVDGHAGELLLGRIEGKSLAVLSGRAHFHEGWPMESITFPVRVLAAFGIKTLLLTNAAGGINRRLRPGDFMVVSDHINLMGVNPLRNHRTPGVSDFVDLTDTYCIELRRLLHQAARQSGIKLHTGVYLAVSGPSYETPAEIRAFERLGADAVGMSTVPEAVVARQYGLRVAALSCITNRAAGLSPKRLSHEAVLETGYRARVLAAQMLKSFVGLYGRAGSR
jgi:purine-nucleoside phosphorylase